MRIGIDLDDTVYDFDRTAREVLIIADTNPKGSLLPEPLSEKQKLELSAGVRWDEWDGIVSIVGEENWSWLWKHANDVNLYQRGLPLKGALKALEILTAEHDVWFLTSRRRDWSHQTYAWLARFNLGATGVIHGPTKWKIAADLDFRMVVDDGPENLRGFVRLAQRGSMAGAYVYGIRRYEPIRSKYERFRYVNSLLDVVTEQERWAK
jgi:hypothetical protein